MSPYPRQSGYVVDVLADARWGDFLLRHPKASVFHSTAWLRSLQRAYGYQSLAFTCCPPPAPLQDAIVFCLVSSRISGNRLVSLPFSDHCDPLVEPGEQLLGLASYASAWAQRKHCRYVEIRPLAEVTGVFQPSQSYYFHEIDLTPGPAAVYRKFHVDCVQRKIRRAGRENLTIEQGNSPELLHEFYRLHTRSRLRLGTLPQPIAWFETLLDEFQDRATIRLARFQGRSVASIFTLEFKQTTVYKYGCSDPEFNQKGGMQVLLWAAIEEACHKGHTKFDLGRTDMEQDGLIAFKDRWGAEKTVIRYYRHPATMAHAGIKPWAASLARKLFSRVPETLAPAMGRLIYRHLA